MVIARSGDIRHGKQPPDLLIARPGLTAGLIHPPVVRHSGRPEPVGHPLSDRPRGPLSPRRAHVRADGYQISNRSAVPHQVHDLTASHPVDRPGEGGRIRDRQFFGVHAGSVANTSPSDLRRRRPPGISDEGKGIFPRGIEQDHRLGRVMETRSEASVCSRYSSKCASCTYHSRHPRFPGGRAVTRPREGLATPVWSCRCRVRAVGAALLELMPRDDPATNLSTCAGCEASWRGAVRAHCRVCHVTFDDDVLFDAHRRTGVCVHPRCLGLIVAGGVWCRLLAGDWTAAS